LKKSSIIAIIYSEMDTPDQAPNCLNCIYFFVTWDSRFPRGCRIFGIKSFKLPSSEVFISTGKHCPAFREGQRKKSNSEA